MESTKAIYVFGGTLIRPVSSSASQWDMPCSLSLADASSTFKMQKGRKEESKFVRNDQERQEARPPILPLQGGSFMKCEEWEGMAKLQRARRWVFSFEEVLLVIVGWVGG